MYNQNEDLAPICNGSGTIQWISLSEYYQTGKITFLQPEQVPASSNTDKSNNCPLCSIFSTIDDEADSLVHLKNNLFSSIYTEQLFFSQVQYLKQEVASANSRAPPYYL